METSNILVISIYLAFQIKWGMDLGGRDYIKVWLFDDPDKTLSIAFYIFLIVVLAFLWYIQNNN